MTERLVLAGVGVVLMATTGWLQAQSTHTDVVIYRECRRPPERLQWGRFRECGVDEAATQRLQDELQATTRPLTPQEERQVEERIVDEFVIPALAAKQADLLALLDWTARRVEALLRSNAYHFTGTDRTALQQAKMTLGQLISNAHEGLITRDDLDGFIAQVRGIVTEVSRIVRATPKVVPSGTPKIESLVTRIDALVARVGTVIRELERAGIVVPPVVRDGHADALQMVRESKRMCSTRRPAACAQLRDVLSTIESMREPLCRLPSELLAFCR